MSRAKKRQLTGSWGYRISLEAPRHQQGWLIGGGSAPFKGRGFSLAYSKFGNNPSANRDIGTRHKYHFHRRAWEYYFVFRGHTDLQINKETRQIPPGWVMEIPAGLPHRLVRRRTPFEGLTIRAPLTLSDKVELAGNPWLRLRRSFVVSRFPPAASSGGQ